MLNKQVIEAALFFSKPKDIEYDVFLNAMVEAMEKMWITLKIPFITLMQQKLGLGRGTEYVLRLYLDEERDNLTEAVRWLTMYKEVGFVRQVLIDEGKLLIKKIIK
jgi:hypothetical protein